MKQIESSNDLKYISLTDESVETFKKKYLMQ